MTCARPPRIRQGSSARLKAAADRNAQARPEAAAGYRATAQALSEAADELEQLRKATRPLPYFNGESIADLPDELLKELNVTKTDDFENQVFTLVKAAGGKADLDTILVGFYRRYGTVHQRRYMQNRLWRMTQKDGVLWSVPDKKGWYATEPPADEAPAMTEADKYAYADDDDEEPFDIPSPEDSFEEIEDDDLPF